MAVAEILIIEDEPDIAELIRFHAEREGLRAKIVASGRVALETVRRERPDLVALDLMLPDLDGLEICRRLKRQDDTREIPILIVSAKGEEADIVAGLELGADDYVTKPFSPRVLMARMRNILRRYEPAANGNGAHVPDGGGRPTALAGGAVTIDSDRHRVMTGREEIGLTRTEFAILEYLAARPGFVRTRDQILSAVHGDSAVLTRRTVDVHMTSIRQKLGEHGELIETVRGVGYRLRESGDEFGE